MAVTLRHPPASSAPAPAAAPKHEFAKPVHAYLARLAALHDEAAETAHLANLLGRAPWVATILGVTALAAAAVSTSSAWAVTIWLALVAAGVIAIARAYSRSIDAPFARATLKVFAQDVSASLLYLGFAWGAALFLVLPADLGVAAGVAFTAGIAIILAGVLRARDVAFCFLVPASAMGAFCALMRPVDGSITVMLAILAGGAVAAGAATLIEKISGQFPAHAAAQAG